jgi:hypothetical protein
MPGSPLAFSPILAKPLPCLPAGKTLHLFGNSFPVLVSRNVLIPLGTVLIPEEMSQFQFATDSGDTQHEQ